MPDLTVNPVGAGLPANTGKAGAIHRVAFFAGKPAPTGELRRGCGQCSLSG
ncbi:diguanylate cyclase [Pantoea sp. Ap-967]|nr:diguanylate cyclase [Pantoea sp. Ap-967]